MTDKSFWQRYIKPYSVALTAGMIFMYMEHGFPIVNASKISFSISWKKTSARLVQKNKFDWQRDMISKSTYSQQWNGKLENRISAQASGIRSRFYRGPIEVQKNHAPFLSTGNPAASRTPQQQTECSSRKKPAAACRTQQQAQSNKQQMQKTTAAASAAGRIQQEQERYCRSTSSQPGRSVWHLQVWKYRTVQHHVSDVKAMQLRENR